MITERCKAKTVAGKPCRAAPMANGLCFLHGNPEKVRTLGQVGGRKNRSRVPELALQPSEINAETLRDILAQAILDVMSNNLSARNAAAVAQLANTFVKIAQIPDLEQRMAKLEEAAAQEHCHQKPIATGAGWDQLDGPETVVNLAATENQSEDD